jgi:hypothetical protein
MSSHREAPEISKDPVADSTDLYAFVSPDRPETVTLIANYVPLEAPAGGPNFFEFGNDVLYEIHVDNDGDALADVTYQFKFTTRITNPNTFLYNTGPITSLTDKNWNRRQFYSVTRIDHRRDESDVLATGLSCPPCNIGPLSTPTYNTLAKAAIHDLNGAGKVFAGQRAEGFYVDLGAVFDLADLRPFEDLNAFGHLPKADGVNATKSVNVHSIAIQVPKRHLTKGQSVIGVWTTASRQKVRLATEEEANVGPYVQISRLGNPLFNEVLVPMSKKDYWNTQPPKDDKQFASGVTHPELAALLPAIYPNVFPHLAAYGKDRADLVAILLTGIKSGVVPGFHNFTGSTQADLLRLNTTIPPSTRPNGLGLLGGDLAGYPNGRRVSDDVFTIELRAIAGATIPLVDPTYVADGAASLVTDGVTFKNYLPEFPYLGHPYSGYNVPAA